MVASQPATIRTENGFKRFATSREFAVVVPSIVARVAQVIRGMMIWRHPFTSSGFCHRQSQSAQLNAGN